MQWRDTGLGFGAITIVLHWVGATLVVAFAAIAVAGLLADAGGGPKSLGLGVAASAISAFRILWRALHHHPLPVAPAAPVTLLLHRAVALALLLAGAVLPWLYFALLSAGPELGLPGWAAALGWLPVWLTRLLFWLGIVLFAGAATLHAGAAVFGALKGGDRSLARMLGAKVEL